MKISIVLSSMLLIFLLAACADSNNGAATPLNPNGDSELALLMRDMEKDALRMKEQLMKGEKPEVIKKFETLQTAEATEPEKAESQEFKIFAESYLQTLNALADIDPENAPQMYHGLVESCMTCHRSMCPGPIVRIEKLYLPKEKK